MRSMGRQKVFCIGYNKTGTTSLEQALRNLGFIMGNQHVAEMNMAVHWAQRDFRVVKWFCHTAEAFQDFPFSYPETYLAMDKTFPGSKFILTVRDSSDQWYESLTHFHTRLWGKGDALPTKEDLEAADMWFIHHAHFNTSTVDPYNREALIGCYERHNIAVTDYFRERPDNLLVLNVTDKCAYQDLCRFLNKPHNQEDFPWENKTP